MSEALKPQAVAIPEHSTTWEMGRYGPIWPKTPACHGFTIIAKVKPGTAPVIREYGVKMARALEGDPYVLAPLKLHYLRWVLFDNDTTYFMYQGIFDTDFDKYTEDAVALFATTGINTVFENLEGFPRTGRRTRPPFVKFVRDHQCPSFLEYGEYPYVTRRRDQEGLEAQGGLLGDARPDAVSRRRSSRRTSR